MELEFIIGRAGSGKTRALFERAAKACAEGGRCFYIVEEQATFEAERGLAALLGGGLWNCAVYSWSSLARRVLDRSGDRRAYLAPQGKLMLTRRAVDICAAKLRIFGKAARFKGFPTECETLIRRFKSCAVTPEALLRAAEGIEEGLPLAEKLYDIALIYAECERLMSERYIDSEDMMNALCERLPETELAGAHVFIDGGAAMNEQCCRVFAKMLRHCAGAAVTFYGGEGRDGALFLPEKLAFERLCGIADSLGVKYKVTRLEPRSDGKAPALAHFERELYAHPFAVFDGDASPLRIYAARDRQDEAEQAAEHIRTAAASGMRYRDMAVAVSDIAAYAPVISRVFGAYGIPYFLDSKRKASEYPVAELILSALTAAERGFDAESVISVLKSGYIDVDPDDAEVFENHLIATGIFGGRLTEPFAEAPEGAERARAAVMEPLMRFRESVRVGTAAERARAIYELLNSLGVYDRQRELVSRLHDEGDYKREEENARVLNVITELLDQLYVILGEGEIGLTRFIAVVREGLASYDIGVIPTTCDQVLVGDAGRTSFPRVRFMQALGLNEGLFPPKRANDGVIDDGDLRAMQSLGLTVWHTSDRLCAKDDLDIYKALSKPTEALYLSCAINCAGELTPPAAIITRIGNIFPGILKESGVGAQRLRGSRAAGLKRLAMSIRRMADTGEPDEEASALYAYFGSEPEGRRALDNIESICFEGSSPAPFGQELASKLYGSSFYGSVSRLETFNRCPFGHFARYGLGAEEREEHVEKSTDYGLFLHDSIDAFTKYVTDSGLDWAELTDEKVFEILREVTPPIMAAYKNGILYETARNRARFVTMLETLQNTCCAITRHIKRGSFRPIGSEVRFGSAEALFPPLPIRLANGMTIYLKGVIDRIDGWKETLPDGGSALHSRIIDYKTGDKKFDLAELAAGLQIQLPIYAAAAAAACRMGEELSDGTVGMYYMHITSGAAEDAEQAVKGESEQTAEKHAFNEKLMEKFRLRGISISEPEVLAATEDFEGSSTVLASASRNKAGEYSGLGLVGRGEYGKVIDDAMRIAADSFESIMQGHAEVSPAWRRGKSPACAYCPYRSVCRFDTDPGTDKYRMINSLSAKEYFGRES